MQLSKTIGKVVAVLGIVGACLLAGSQQADAQKKYTGYYSQKHYASSYAYRYYNYYSPKYGQNKQHMAIYYPSRPKYVYYYNPYSKKYWGRADLQTGGYSLLADQDKRGLLSDIPESAFPPAGPMPAPEPGMGDPMLPPPEALGSGGGTPPFNIPQSPDGGCHKN